MRVWVRVCFCCEGKSEGELGLVAGVGVGVG